jgi:hypothetical protein
MGNPSGKKDLAYNYYFGNAGADQYTNLSMSNENNFEKEEFQIGYKQNNLNFQYQSSQPNFINPKNMQTFPNQNNNNQIYRNEFNNINSFQNFDHSNQMKMQNYMNADIMNSPTPQFEQNLPINFNLRSEDSNNYINNSYYNQGYGNYQNIKPIHNKNMNINNQRFPNNTGNSCGFKNKYKNREDSNKYNIQNSIQPTLKNENHYITGRYFVMKSLDEDNIHKVKYLFDYIYSQLNIEYGVVLLKVIKSCKKHLRRQTINFLFIYSSGKYLI